MRGKSLVSSNPRLADQWHPTKNDDLTPENVTSQSKSKAWWLGLCGHEWESAVGNRNRGVGCPFCSGNQVLAGFNDLATTHPDMAGEWAHDLNEGASPESVSIGSNKPVWWRCAQDHTWRAQPNNRKSAKNGCPACAGLVLAVGVNDLATKVPVIAALWHPNKNGNLLPSAVTYGSKIRFWWQCTQGHDWQDNPNTLTSKDNGDYCPVCTGHRLMPGVNDLASVSPALASQWHPVLNGDTVPSDVITGGKRRAWWVCDQGHEWQALIKDRVTKNSGCPYCSGRKFLSGFNDLATQFPQIAAQWHPTQNGDVSPGDLSYASGTSVWWQCEHGHEWRTSVEHRTRPNNSTHCPECSRYARVITADSLATLRPDLTAQWNTQKNLPLTPAFVTPGADRPVWWTCEKGHEWNAIIKNRALLGSGCPACYAKSFVSKPEQEIADLVQEWGFKVQTSDRRSLKGQELDIFIPALNLAVEFNGLYWHSERFKHKNYHRDKAQACRDAGIYLYQVWEDDWRDRRLVVLAGLASRLGVTRRLHDLVPETPTSWSQTVGARSLRRVHLVFKEVKDFLATHHIQEAAVGSHYLGLKDKHDQVRAVLVLKKVGNAGRAGEYLIERYASMGSVPGGFTRLLSWAEDLIPDVATWVTFADLAVSDGNLYDIAGFTQDRILAPDYTYLVNGTRQHKFNYRLSRFRNDTALLWEEGMTERELAGLNGLYRIWDSGKVRYTKIVQRDDSMEA